MLIAFDFWHLNKHLVAMQNNIAEKLTNNVLIVQIEPPQAEQGGDYYYRTYAPSISLSAEECIHVINLSNICRKREELLQLADILILKNICDPDILPVIAARKKAGKISIYEVADDLGAIPAWNPVYFFYQNKENISLFKKTAASCDAIQFTVCELNHKYGYLNQNTAVFPNQISIVPPERKAIDNQKEIIIGWGGSHGHMEDMKVMAPLLIEWIINHPKIKLYLMCSNDIWNLFRELPAEQKKLFPTGSLETYYDFLKNIDIGLAPLNNTAFNRSRSDVKFLEYAISEVVPVLQDLEPYRDSIIDGHTGFLFDSPVSLISTLTHLYSEPQLRMHIARQARAYVLQHRLQKNHNKERLDFYFSLLRRTDHEDKEINKIFETMEKDTGASRIGNYLRLSRGLFEESLYNGLIFSQINNDKIQARSMFDMAQKLEPRNYLPYLFGASIMPDPIQSLHRAIELNPGSIKSFVLLGEQYAVRNDFMNALKYFESAANLFPAYEIPYIRSANVLKSIGQFKAAEDLLHTAEALTI